MAINILTLYTKEDISMEYLWYLYYFWIFLLEFSEIYLQKTLMSFSQLKVHSHELQRLRVRLRLCQIAILCL